MKLAVFIDPLKMLNPEKDSSIAMIQSAQSMGWSCAFFTQHDIFCKDGRAYARMTSISIGDITSSNWAKTKPLGDLPLDDFGIILVRKDPPFTMEYVYALHALELAEKLGVLVANKPQSLRDANEKMFTLLFAQCAPYTLVTQDKERLRDFWKMHRSVIFKPLDAMGGQSVFHVVDDGLNLSVILETLTNNETVTIMAQKYIPDIINSGDKRVILINGDPVPYALARIPAKGEFRGNLAAGGSSKVVPITQNDRWICDQVAPTLKAKGLYFVGIDIIGRYLTEINVTSPTCIRQITAVTGLDIAGEYLRTLNFIKNRKN